MNWRIIGYTAAVIVFFVLMGGIGYKIVAPTSKTIVGQGGKVITVNTESPKVPIGGCALWRLNTKLYWEKPYNSSEIKK